MSSDKVATSEVAEQDAAVNRNGDQPASETKPESPPPEETSSLDSDPQAAPVEPQSGELRAAEADGSSGAGGTAEDSDAPARRLKLNPTIGTDQARAIPNVAPPDPGKPPEPSAPGTPAAPAQASAAPTEPPPAIEDSGEVPDTQPADEQPENAETGDASIEAETEAVMRSAALPPHVSGGPVELPPKNEPLDAELEAQIAAAMSADQAQPEIPAAAATDTESEEAAAEGEDAFTVGSRLKGVVQSIHGENVFIDLGVRSPGFLPMRQFTTGQPPEVGQQLDLVVVRVDEEEGLIHVNLPRGSRKVGGDWDAVSVGQVVDCMVEKTNKGGLEVKIGSLRGFMPAGQVDLGYISDLSPYVGQKLQAQIVEVNPRRRNLVVSRRALLEAERKEAEDMLWVKLEEGQTYQGTVKTLKDYGAFIDIGGVDGFLHIGEMSWNRINHPSDVLQEGQDVEVKVLTLDPEKKRIGLGMRQLMPNPWKSAGDRYAKGTTVSGTVTRTAPFGAFVELEEGVEGLVHISELDHRRVGSVTQVLNVGQQADFQVLEVDPNRKRISLSLKALMAEPEPEAPKEDERAPVVRKRKEKLKGGMGEATPGNLFGDPRDFK